MKELPRRPVKFTFFMNLDSNGNYDCRFGFQFILSVPPDRIERTSKLYHSFVITIILWGQLVAGTGIEHRVMSL